MPSRDPLSEVPPDEFIKARNALARELKERGESEEARRVAARRRPSTVLWIVNQLGRRAPREVEELIESTRRARRAQVQGGGAEELREVMRAQREAAHRLLGEAEQTAARAGLALTPEQQRRIQDTLQTAASMEPDALREGTLQHELSPAGFGALLSGPAAVAAKAASRKQTFETRAEEQKRLLADRRERMLRQREVQHAQQAARRLAGRAEQLEHRARQATDTAEKAKTKAEEARRAANDAAARLIELQKNA
jgi:hypothetical protein